LAIETATREGADYVLAQDPDADRFTAAERRFVLYSSSMCSCRSTNVRSTGEWTLFTGDQLGVIFASNILEAFKLSGKPLNTLAMVASTVSSRMLESMAKVEGFRFVECLTGAFSPKHYRMQMPLIVNRFQVYWKYRPAS